MSSFNISWKNAKRPTLPPLLCRSRSWEVHMARFATLVLAAAIAGCAVGPDYKQPASPVAPGQFAEMNRTASNADAPEAAFWKLFNDDTLNLLELGALNANHDLRIALARL